MAQLRASLRLHHIWVCQDSYDAPCLANKQNKRYNGTLDHVPTNLIDKLAPSLVEHQERVGKDSIVTQYYVARAS